MKQSSFSIALTFLAGFAFVGCTTLPAPDKSADTLLVIPTHFIKHTSPYLFGRFHARIASANGSTVIRDVPIEPTAEYQVVEGLPEGNYRIPEYYFVYDDRPKDTKPIAAWVMFSMQSGRLTILDNLFEYDQRGDGSTFYYSGRWRQITVDELSSFYEKLSREENFKGWQISDYTNELLNVEKDPQVHPLDGVEPQQE